MHSASLLQSEVIALLYILDSRHTIRNTSIPVHVIIQTASLMGSIHIKQEQESEALLSKDLLKVDS